MNGGEHNRTHGGGVMNLHDGVRQVTKVLGTDDSEIT